ncbi:MAG: hypothetical protein OSB33_07175 [Candidatus Poseidoniales archaeon]|nr:hypothetical protein [Candidatus Poseidoniales archaeon]
MEGEDTGKRRRGPPASKRKRTLPSQTTPDEEGEWYDDVVDNSQTEERGFGGFSVKRPQMSSTDQVEGQQLERYFEKQYHDKSTEKRASIEEDWDETESEFSFKSLLDGYRTILLGVQSFMIALPLILISAALIWGGHSVMNSMGGSTGALLNIMMVFLAICLTTISFIQIVVSAVNQSLRERQIAKDGPDIPLLGWSGSLQLSSQVFTEVILTFLMMWTIQILGLYMLAGAMPDLSMPTIDTDNLSVGTLLYMLGSVGSLFVMIGIIPYSIEATIKRS